MFLHRSIYLSGVGGGWVFYPISFAHAFLILIYIRNEKKEVQSSPNSSFENLYT
jgi:hypothetical protein